MFSDCGEDTEHMLSWPVNISVFTTVDSNNLHIHEQVNF